MTTPVPAVGVFDLETTGVDHATERIVTAYVGALDATGAVIWGKEWMIRPDGYVIPDGAAAIHGVTTEQALAEGRPSAEVIPEILDALTVFAGLGVPVITHNGSYDLSLFVHELDRSGHPDPVAAVEPLVLIDTFLLDKQFDKYRRGKRTLTAIAPLYGVVLTEEEAHGAKADAIAAGRIGLFFLARHLTGVTPENLTRLQRQWAREQRASLLAYRRNQGDAEFTIDLNWPLYDTALALRAPEPEYTF